MAGGKGRLKTFPQCLTRSYLTRGAYSGKNLRTAQYTHLESISTEYERCGCKSRDEKEREGEITGRETERAGVKKGREQSLALSFCFREGTKRKSHPGGNGFTTAKAFSSLQLS